MKLTGLHILLTYQCTFECDHCFVWGSPWQKGTLTLAQVRQVLEQAKETGTVEEIYFEGGEPFLYYATLLQGAQAAADLDFEVGLVSNAYWANSRQDALAFLQPFQGMLDSLTFSSDLYHYNELMSAQAQNACLAAADLGIACSVLTVAQPETQGAHSSLGTLSDGSAVMFRGRAAEKLAGRVLHHKWEEFTTCPHEDLREPGRLHLDPLGNLHICQGISLGNVFETPLKQICAAYDPDAHPICGPLLAGGPAALVTEYALPHEQQYADACQLCYEARLLLRGQFPEILKPDQMYGVGLIT